MELVCPNCSHRNHYDVAGSTVKNKVKFKAEGQSIYLTYYDCEKCGNRVFVGIDNQITLKMLHKSKDQMTVMMKAKRGGSLLGVKQMQEFKKQNSDLAQTRNKLMEHFTGVVVHDTATDKDYTLKFYV